MADFEDAVRIALTLPEANHHGTALEVGGKGFAWVYMEKVPGRKGRVERRDVLAIRVAHLVEKAALVASDPPKFFDTEHYHGFPAILVNLAAIDTDELTELLTDGWRTRAPRRLVKLFDSGEFPPLRREDA